MLVTTATTEHLHQWIYQSCVLWASIVRLELSIRSYAQQVLQQQTPGPEKSRTVFLVVLGTTALSSAAHSIHVPRVFIA